jgi:hypothetical protein
MKILEPLDINRMIIPNRVLVPAVRRKGLY